VARHEIGRICRELMALCDRLEASLITAAETRKRLLNVLARWDRGCGEKQPSLILATHV
jgi:hypothetical protein